MWSATRLHTGAIAFLLYINDIVTSSELFKFIMFADDTNLFLSNVSLDLLGSNVNIELAKVFTYFLKVKQMNLFVSQKR